MAIAKEDILEAVGAMSVLELNDLVKAFEEKFGVSAAAVAVAGPTGGGAAAAVGGIQPGQPGWGDVADAGDVTAGVFGDRDSFIGQQQAVVFAGGECRHAEFPGEAVGVLLSGETAADSLSAPARESAPQPGTVTA